MQESAKYLIHADITASGVVERSDVVGAVFGQTEGLLGEELELRELQESGQLGRIDVEIRSESGASFGSITIASGLDKVQTAILAAALESIERVGPCRATVEVDGIEDVRSAKRREVVERATELLAEFEETALTNDELVEAVRQSLRVEDVTEYEGVPAGPRVAESDAVVVVEGRADVLTLLRYGVKNAVAVEGTDVPDAVAELTAERTVTAFLDGDRGGTLILRELAQVGDVDYVAFAPEGRSVEDLSRGEIMDALRQKVPYGMVEGESDPAAAVAATDGSTRPAPPGTVDPEIGDARDRAATPDEATEETPEEDDTTVASEAASPPVDADADVARSAGESASGRPGASAAASPAATDGVAARDAATESDAPPGSDAPAEQSASGSDDDRAAAGEQRPTLADHVDGVVKQSSGRARLLDDDGTVLGEVDADGAFDALESAETVPRTAVIDGGVSQRVLDVAAQRGVEEIVARDEGEFVKQPTSVRIRLAEEF